MDFGKQIDEHEASETTRHNQQAVTQKVTNTNTENTTQQITENQTGDTNDADDVTGFFKYYHRCGG